MKHADINKRYTEIVTEWIGKGYTINTSTMSGSQGEKAKIDLTNGTEIIRILVCTFHDWDENTDGVEIIVGKCTDKVKPHDGIGYDTIWNDRLEVLHQERFYKIGRNRSDYYGTQAEAKAAADKSIERYRRKDIAGYEKVNFTDAKAVQLAKSYILRKNICKRVNLDNISVYKTISRKGYVQYCVAYKATGYALH